MNHAGADIPPPQERASAARVPWWKGAVTYQIYPRSFLDTTGDGIGDLAGVTKGLSHVASLGVDAVWLSPFFTSPMEDFGYDVADYCGVDPIFGTLNDFDVLVARAHDLGLKVIIDQVYSHTSSAHPWFAESRQSRTNARADWYVWADPKPDGSPPNNWQSVFGGPSWQWDARRGQYYLHNFLTSQPDLNLHNEKVREALLEVTRFWLNRGVDGFRLDAINFAMHDPALRDNPPATHFHRPPTRPFDFQEHLYNMSHPDIPQFLEELATVVNEAPGRFTVAEVVGMNALAEMKAFTQGAGRLNSAYSFNYLYADALSPALVASTTTDWTGAPGEGWPSWAFSNHDAPRAVSRWSGGNDLSRHARLYALLLLSLRGNAFLYQGEELGLPQADVPFEALQDPEAIANWPETLGRDGARTPLPWRNDAPHAGFSNGVPWLPVDERHAGRAIDLQEGDPGSVLHYFRKLIAFRKTSPALKLGEIAFADVTESLLAFTRSHGGEELLCVFNLGAEDCPLGTLAAGRTIAFASDGADELAGMTLPPALPPHSGFIAKKASN